MSGCLVATIWRFTAVARIRFQVRKALSCAKSSSSRTEGVCQKGDARPSSGFLLPGTLHVGEGKCDEPPGLLPSTLFFLYFRNLVSHIWSFASKENLGLNFGKTH